MADPPRRSSSPRRRPSIKVSHSDNTGGQRRRRLTRRSVFPPRSNTMPVLSNQETSSLPMMGMAIGAGAYTHTTSTPTKSASAAVTAHPSTPKTPLDSKKKRHGLLEALKAKDRPGSSGGFEKGEISPLPPLTPKAAQVLGITMEGVHNEGRIQYLHQDELSDSEDEYLGQIQTDGGEDDGRSGLRVQPPVLRQRASESLLSKGTSSMHMKAEEDSMGDVHASTGTHDTAFAKRGNKRAMRVLDLLPHFHPRNKTAPLDSSDTPTLISAPLLENEQMQHIDIGYDSDPSLRAPRRPRSRKARKKRNERPLQIMTPITESSLSEGGSVLDRDDPELDALYSAYATHRASYIDSSVPRSVTIPTIQPQYELAAEELSDVEESKEDQPQIVQCAMPIFGAVPDYSISSRHSSSKTVQVQSPLQKFEHHLLDATEEKMRGQLVNTMLQEMGEDQRLRLKIETRKSLIMAQEKTAMDAEISRLKDGQTRMKWQFRRAFTRDFGHDETSWISPEIDDEEDTDAMLSDYSPISKDEESETGLAKKVPWWEIPYKSVTRDMIKIIHYTTRKQDDIMGAPPASIDQATPTVASLDKNVRIQKEPQVIAVLPFSRIDSEGESPDQDAVGSPLSAPAALGDTHNKEQLEPFPPFIDRWDESDQLEELFLRPEDSRLPRETSRLFVQNWVNQCGYIEERPLSSSYDPVVLIDRKYPPAPLPKDVTTPPTRRPPPPPKGVSLPSPRIPAKSPLRTPLKTPSRRPKYHCLHTGHKFRPINLKKVPDNVAIGPLETRPFLNTSAGTKQHVRIPVHCEKCGEDCQEVIYECEIPACHTSVCFECAALWQEDASRQNIDTWK